MNFSFKYQVNVLYFNIPILTKLFTQQDKDIHKKLICLFNTMLKQISFSHSNIIIDILLQTNLIDNFVSIFINGSISLKALSIQVIHTFSQISPNETIFEISNQEFIQSLIEFIQVVDSFTQEITLHVLNFLIDYWKKAGVLRVFIPIIDKDSLSHAFHGSYCQAYFDSIFVEIAEIIEKEES
jgi:hypothetical protein